MPSYIVWFRQGEKIDGYDFHHEFDAIDEVDAVVQAFNLYDIKDNVRHNYAFKVAEIGTERYQKLVDRHGPKEESPKEPPKRRGRPPKVTAASAVGDDE